MDSDRYHCKLPDRRLPNRVTSELPVIRLNHATLRVGQHYATLWENH